MLNNNRSSLIPEIIFIPLDETKYLTKKRMKRDNFPTDFNVKPSKLIEIGRVVSIVAKLQISILRKRNSFSQ